MLGLVKFLFQKRLHLLVAGILTEIVYIVYFFNFFPLIPNYNHIVDLGGFDNHTSIGFWNFIIVVCMLYIVYALALRVTKDFSDKKTLLCILLFGFVFGVTLTFVYPITANDIYTYIAQSRILTYYHRNPIFVTPAMYPSDAIMQFSGKWGDYGSPYGPLGIVIAAIPVSMSQGNLLMNMIFMKFFFTCFTTATAFFVYKILKQIKPGAALTGALLVAWNPLILFEISINGHNDIVMLFFTVVAIYLLLQEKYKTATIMLVVSALVKYATIILLPLFVWYAISRLRFHRKISYILWVVAGSFFLLASVYYPFWEGSQTFNRAFFENTFYLHSFSSVLGNTHIHIFDKKNALITGRIIFIAIYIYILLVSAKSKERFLQGCFLSLFFFLALVVSQFKIWYGVWPVVLAATVPGFLKRFIAVVFSFGATISAAIFGFVWIWLGMYADRNFIIVNDSAYAITFLPAFFIFAGSALLRCKISGIARVSLFLRKTYFLLPNKFMKR